MCVCQGSARRLFITYLIGLIPLLSAMLTAFAGVYTWKQRVAGAKVFALFASSIFIWTFLALPEYYSQTLSSRALFGKLQYLGIVLMPVSWFVFTFRYTQRDAWLTRRVCAALLLIPVLTLFFALTDPWLGLVWKHVSYSNQPFPRLVIEHGLWFEWVLTPFIYILFMSGVFVILFSLVNDSSLYRRQTGWVFLASSMPFILNVSYLLSDFHLYGLDPTPYGFTLCVLMITYALFARHQMRITPVSYRGVFLNTADAAFLLNAEKEIIDLNPAALKELQSDQKDVLGQSFERVFPEYQTIFSMASEHHHRYPLELGQLPFRRFIEVNLSPLLNSNGQQAGYVLLLRDVTTEHEQRATLETFAYKDSLTDIANRRQLGIEAENAFALAKRYELKLAVLYIDLDGFKNVNDTFGHDLGDEVLIQVARCLRQTMRTNDVVARIGGDEFAVLLYNSNLQATIDTRERLQHKLAHLPLSKKHRLTVQASIGYALYPDNGSDLSELLRHADTAMYEVKRTKIKS